MLRELLRLVENAQGPVGLSALSRELGVGEAVLDGMLQHWVRKGRLEMDGGSSIACAGGCAPGTNRCGSCAGISGCPFVARLPITYRLSSDE